jgi:hypothetical protein
MARNHWSKEKRRKPVEFDLGLIDGGEENKNLDEEWTQRWRENLLSIAWQRLADWEKSKPESIAHTVLRLRSDHPNHSSTELAARLSEILGREVKPDTTRQHLRRARVRFVEFLVAEIADGLPEAGPDELKEELIALGLFSSVKDVLPQEWQA